jgi:RHS repeat-associated protein
VANNRLQSDGVYTYEYDDEGNQERRTKIATGEVTEYFWDHRNRLITVKQRASAGGMIQWQVDYGYDAFDRMISRTLDADGQGGGGAVTTFFVYDGLQVVLALSPNGTVERRMLWGPAVDQLLASEDAGGVKWALADQLGTVRDVVDSSGILITHRKYDAFGNLVSGSTDPGWYLGYTGRFFDLATGLQWNWQRWYDPKTGRWLSQDPIGFEGGDTNLYRYVENGPTNATDPTGESLITAIPRGAYKKLQALIKKSGFQGLVHIHHKIGIELFKHKDYGPWLRKMGYCEGDMRNLIILPTREGREKGVRGSLHGGRHIKEYVEDVVKKRLTDIQEQYYEDLRRLGFEKARELVQQQIAQLQKQLTKGLRDGTIKLQRYDVLEAGGVLSVGGLFVIMPEEVKLSDSALDALDVARASNYTGEKGILGMAGWIADLVNPVDDFKFFCETAEEMFRPIGQTYDRGMQNMQHNRSIKMYRYALDDPEVRALIRNKPGSTVAPGRPKKPPPPAPTQVPKQISTWDIYMEEFGRIWYNFLW